MLECSDGSYYVGHTDDIETRLAIHHSGEIKCYTSDKRPLKLVWADVTSSRYEAIMMERRIKGWSRKKKQALVQQDWEQIKNLSKKIFKK